MVCARLHIICGNCGCNDMFEYSIDPKGQDFGDHFKPSVRLHCRNCATIHALEDNAAPIAQTPADGLVEALEQSRLTGNCIIEVVAGKEGPSLYIGDEISGHRLAGNKPWGGGTTLHKFSVRIDELVREAKALAAHRAGGAS